jgi:16S rRNA (uracil1498-N3)-methyltransferase
VSRVAFVRRAEALGQFRVPDPEVPVLSDTDAHHLWRVLRARPGEEVVVTNGAGAWSFARIGDDRLERISDVVIDEPDGWAELYLAPLKADRSEWAIAKATELGISRITPLMSEYVVTKSKGFSLDKTIAKWRRIADAAAGQCRRTYDVQVAAPVLIDHVPASVAVADFEGDGSLDGVSAIAIGPEGGWSEREWGPDRVRLALGTTVLRGETAAVAAATLLVQRRDGWSRHVRGGGVGNDGESQ